MHGMQYHQAIKKNEILSATEWTQVKNIKLGELT